MECPKHHVFRLSKKKVFEGVLVFFLTKECPILTALKQMVFDEIKQSIGIKTQKISLIMIFCMFLPVICIFVFLFESQYWHGRRELTRTHGIDMDSWYKHGFEI